ncbi:MAG: hypothetical protein F4Y60_10340 [Boseongicola sp. SB0664_bin_43]|uniref:Uncharacterized protein n=1 Tax=Boseongicola sp. SB0664_bin_43 TaxID=2604844 RepID=A0A6B0Y434_9RHOB|nr:hypothetical protein [Boseongicola sp. SB0664_bin_43]
MSDGAGDEVEKRVESGFAQAPLVVRRREKPFPNVLSMLATRLSDEQVEAFLHLLEGAARRQAVETDDFDQPQGPHTGRREHAGALFDGSTDVARHDVCLIQTPVRHQPF